MSFSVKYCNKCSQRRRIVRDGEGNVLEDCCPTKRIGQDYGSDASFEKDYWEGPEGKD